MVLLPALLALSLAAAPTATAPPSREVRERVLELLGSIHGPVSPDAFRAAGPGAEQVLAEVAGEGGMPSRRIRALEALAGLGGARAEAVHREVSASPTAPSAVRRTAIRGLGHLLGPAAASKALAPVLEGDRDPGVRAAAAEALATAAPAEGCPRIRARARAEPEPSRFGRALEACDRASGGWPER